MDVIGTTPGKEDDYMDVEGRERREHVLEVELRRDAYRDIDDTTPWTGEVESRKEQRSRATQAAKAELRPSAQRNAYKSQYK